MSKTVINFKTDRELKNKAKKVLDEMGLNFSIAFNGYLKKIIEDRRIEFIATEKPSNRLKKSIKEAEKEFKNKTSSGPFKNTSDFRKSLGV